MAKTLQIWNGRGFTVWETKIHFDHAYVCAESGAEAVKLLQKAGHTGMNYNELKNYWSKGCWGNSMDGITPEKGVWANQGHCDPVERLL